MEGISINISEPIDVKADIRYNMLTPIKKNIYAPNIMGPFAYCNFLECYHGVISLYHNLNGNLRIIMGNKESIYNFSNDVRIYRKRLGNKFS